MQNNLALEFLGFQSNFIEQVWLYVEGKAKGTMAYALSSNSFELATDKSGTRSLIVCFPNPSKEVDYVCDGYDYEVHPFYQDNNGFCYADVNDPREVKVICPAVDAFKLDDAILNAQTMAEEGKLMHGFWRRKDHAKLERSNWLNRVTEITGNNQYRIIANEYGDNRIECSKNLQGKLIKFVGVKLFYQKYVWRAPRSKALPVSLYLVGHNGSQVKMVQVKGQHEPSAVNKRFMNNLKGGLLVLKNPSIVRSKIVA